MGQAAFVCGGIFGNLALPTFSSDPAAATKLESIDDALALRSMIGRHHHGMESYRVHELTDDGRLIDVEP
jgi:hypothetical protein